MCRERVPKKRFAAQVNGVDLTICLSAYSIDLVINKLSTLPEFRGCFKRRERYITNGRVNVRDSEEDSNIFLKLLISRCYFCREYICPHYDIDDCKCEEEEDSFCICNISEEDWEDYTKY